MADIKTPFGPMPKGMVIGVLVIGGGVGIYAYVHNKNKKAKTPQSSDGTGDTGASSYGYGSGQYGYGSGQYGYGAYTYEPYGYGYGPSGLGEYPGGNYYGYGYYGAGVGYPVPQQASTNAQWSQAAVSALTAQGYGGQDVLNALGPYLSGQNLTQSQTQIVYTAIAVEGYPPVAGTNGYPPAIKTGGGGGGGQGGQVIVPNVIGWPEADAFAMIREAGLKPVGANTKVAEGNVKSTNPPAGAKVNKGSSVRVTTSVAKKGKK